MVFRVAVSTVLCIASVITLTDTVRVVACTAVVAALTGRINTGRSSERGGRNGRGRRTHDGKKGKDEENE